MAGNSSSSPAWSHGMLALSGQPDTAAALTGSRVTGLPRRPSSRRGSRGSPWSDRICHTVCAEMGRPWAVSASAISVTLCSVARSSSTLVRSSPVALRGPFGPGLDSANSRIRPVRSRVAIWCTLAVE
jgi:hypothetical protein